MDSYFKATNSILEYNEKKNVIHFNSGNNEENTFGYQTVSQRKPDNILHPFCDYIDFKYPKGTTFKNFKYEFECYEYLLTRIEIYSKLKP